MKRLTLLILFLVLNISSVFSQEKPVEDKNDVIAEIIRVTNTQEKFKESFEMIMKSMNSTYPSMTKAILDGDESLTTHEREIIEKTINEKRSAFEKKFRKRLLKEIDFEEYMKIVVYPMYEKFFDKQELLGLLKFYKSPVGQKLLSVQTEMAVESIKGSQKVLLPKITKIVREIAEEDIEESKSTQKIKNKRDT